MELFRGRVFVVLGRTYRALWSPPDRDNVFAVETGDQVSGLFRAWTSEPEMPSFEELLASECGAIGPDVVEGEIKLECQVANRAVVFNDLQQKPSQPLAK
jgi:hypothetical protein